MVQQISIEKLNAAPYNPRVMLEPGMPEWDRLKRSIEELGNVRPIIWNKRTGNVVNGHQRLAVLKSMGAETVPCSVVDLDEKDEKILNVSLNKIQGRWDYDKLEDVLRGFDYEAATVTGFTADEIAVILANNDDLMDDEADYGGWDDEPEEQIIGGSYVVTLIFADRELAAQWAEKEGHKDKIRDGSSTTVIRVEE